ncbi:MAG: hypothetical protein ABW092_15635 [Candidatus Thiodiazotropha sp.]
MFSLQLADESLALMNPHPLEDAYFSGKRLKRQRWINTPFMNTDEWLEEDQEKDPRYA